MDIEKDIKEAEDKLIKLKDKQQKELKQMEIDNENSFKIVCSCGAEQSIDNYWKEKYKDRKILLGMDWYDSSIRVECNGCGKKIRGRNWGSGC